jgi:hypothetical protein
MTRNRGNKKFTPRAAEKDLGPLAESLKAKAAAALAAYRAAYFPVRDGIMALVRSSEEDLRRAKVNGANSIEPFGDPLAA